MSKSFNRPTPSSSITSVLDEPSNTPKVDASMLDERTILKLKIAEIVFQDQYQLRGLAGMLKIKHSLTKSIIEDVRAAMEIVDEVFDAE